MSGATEVKVEAFSFEGEVLRLQVGVPALGLGTAVERRRVQFSGSLQSRDARTRPDGHGHGHVGWAWVQVQDGGGFWDAEVVSDDPSRRSNATLDRLVLDHPMLSKIAEFVGIEASS